MTPRPKPKPKSKKQKRKPPKEEFTLTPTEDPNPSEFSFAIARIAVSQICQSVGFRKTKLSALQALTHVAIKYLQTIAKASASYTAEANRTDSNVFDFANALCDLQSLQGFAGASRLHQNEFCLLGSGVLIDIANFVELINETPFARPIPRREGMGAETSIPIPRESDSRGSFHVPRWLPGFPDVKKSVVKRRNGEELWEKLLVENGGVAGESESSSGNGNGDGGNKFCLELGDRKRRGRVRFSIGGVEEERRGVGGLGVNLRSGVCRGGKRVCWNNSKNGHNLNTRIHEVADDDDKR